jgi:hypothetical protein
MGKSFQRDERQRDEVAIWEHLTYIEALLSRNISIVELACWAPLASAKETLIRSTSGKNLPSASSQTGRELGLQQTP